MLTYLRFEELPVWQDAADLYDLVTELLEQVGLPISPRFRSRLDGAALSISNNIAEIFDRISMNELIYFLSVARATAGEVRSMTGLARRRKCRPAIVEQLSQIRALAESCGRQLPAWISSLENSPIVGKRHKTSETKRGKNRTIRNRQSAISNQQLPNETRFNHRNHRPGRFVSG
jgi:four helix bundle protein